MPRREFHQLITLEAGVAVLVGAAIAASLGACAAPRQTLYCADEHRYVVEAENCERDDSTYFIYYGRWGSTYKPGAQLPQISLKGRVAATDTAGREKLGVPARGGYGGNGAKFSMGG